MYVKEYPSMKKSYYKLGVEAYKKGSLDEAIEYFTKSINANYRTADAYCTRGVVYGDKGNITHVSWEDFWWFNLEELKRIGFK